MEEKLPVKDILGSKPLRQFSEGVQGQSSGSGGNTEKSKTISYKDKLLHLNGEGYVSEDDEEDWMERQRREEEEEGMEEDLEEEDNDPLCPTYKISKAQHKEDCKKWKKALIIKLLGRRISSRFLLARLQRLWGLTGTFEAIDLDNGYIVLCFSDDRDYIHVLQEGPWVIADHYLIVQRWRPLFNPYEDVVQKLAIWMRLPGLPIELYSNQHLWRIDNIFGRTLKVDKNFIRTAEEGDGEITEKARFARICVEVNLNKSLVSHFKIGNWTIQVGYEGLHLICFSCGKYEQKKDQCGIARAPVATTSSSLNQKPPVKTLSPEVECKANIEDEAFGN
ncbi:uncharacterized protein LOC133290248 [Gastrolobium bilobum]|uniref:uncharacterized protein LOC133290248 n=1 Tax=Gastrolobium bilobum TaxID=150636 RepID=UPI002AB2CB73|nr:uncharacterized protein LOC133290248 [Gastrolobium bilobum]